MLSCSSSIHVRLLFFFIFLLLPLSLIQCIATSSSPSHDHHHQVNNNGERDRIHAKNGHTIHQVSPQLLFEIKLHGFLLWASLGFLMPIGVLVIRLSQREEHGRSLKIMFYAHVVLEILAVLLATAGAILSLKNFDNSFKNCHQRLGLALYIIVWLQTLIGFMRPRRGSKARGVWFFGHWLLGTVVSILGAINIYTGLQAYNKRTSSTNANIWTIIFSIQISLVLFFYLLQEKWYYIKKATPSLCNNNDAVQPTTDQEKFPGDDEKKDVLTSQSTTEPC